MAAFIRRRLRHGRPVRPEARFFKIAPRVRPALLTCARKGHAMTTLTRPNPAQRIPALGCPG